MKRLDFFTHLPSVLPQGYLKERIATLLKKGGLPQGYFTGLDELDRICRVDKGRLVTVTGIPNLGKSEFVDFLTTTYNKQYGFKTLYFSPENLPVELHLDKLIRKYTCKPLIELSDEERDTAISYILDHFFFINSMDVTKLKDILSTAETMIVEKGIDVLVIDPYNRIDVEQSATDIETQYISRILDDLCRLAIRCNIMVFLVAHPRKMSNGRGGVNMPTAYDINGSANFFNKSDYVFVVHRDNQETRTTIKVDKVKFSNYGKPGECEIEYDEVSGNYYSTGDTPEDIPFFDDDYSNTSISKPVPFQFPKVEKKNPLDVKVSFYKDKYATEGEEISLKDFLFSDKYKDIAALIRSGATPEQRHAIKDEHSAELPCVTPSGLFHGRGAANLVEHSGLLCVDIDGHDNSEETMLKVQSILSSLPYVAYASHSISGDGFFALVPIEHPELHKAHFLALEKEFKEAYGIVIDKSCKDVSRLRYASYDEHPYYNPNATSYYHEFVEPQKQGTVFHTTYSTSPSFSGDYDVTRSVKDLDKKIEKVKEKGTLVAEVFDDWFRLGMSLATLGEEGRARYHAISSISPRYDKEECDKDYTYYVEHYDNSNEFSLRTAHKILNEAIQQAAKIENG